MVLGNCAGSAVHQNPAVFGSFHSIQVIALQEPSFQHLNSSKIMWLLWMRILRSGLRIVARFDAVRDGASLDGKPDGEFPKKWSSFTANFSSEYYKHGLCNADVGSEKVVVVLRENLTFRRRGNMVGYLSHMNHMTRLMARMAVAQTLLLAHGIASKVNLNLTQLEATGFLLPLLIMSVADAAWYRVGWVSSPSPRSPARCYQIRADKICGERLVWEAISELGGTGTIALRPDSENKQNQL
ncbi:hypothetical protein B0H13DRAFT_1917396 [Mycena leptocephala]|nr:hypothetical protein B0H13DRAFT_1917396 [Mycena leptocephala]